jgi:hypothetical protein
MLIIKPATPSLSPWLCVFANARAEQHCVGTACPVDLVAHNDFLSPLTMTCGLLPFVLSTLPAIPIRLSPDNHGMILPSGAKHVFD